MLKKTLPLCVVLLALVACSKENVEYTYPKPVEDRRQERAGRLFSGAEGGGLSLFNWGKNRGNASHAVGNSTLWQASIKTVSEIMPIISSDADGGVIATDWFSLEGKGRERFKFNIILNNTELSPASINISGFRQVRSGSSWVDKKVSDEVINSLKENILKKAREIESGKV